MYRVKTALWFALVFVPAFLFFDSTIFVDRWDYRHAVSVYIQNPTPENEARLRSQRWKNEQVKAADAAVPATIMTALAFGMFAIYRSVRKPNAR